MNIQQAISKAIEEKKGITRLEWIQNHDVDYYIWLHPTDNNKERIEIYIGSEFVSFCWNPKTEDLVATDWQLH